MALTEEIYEAHTHLHDIQPKVMEDAAGLYERGYGVRLDDTPDAYAYDFMTQASVDQEIAQLEAQAEKSLATGASTAALLPHGRAAFEHWGPLTKRAVALHNIYNPTISYLGEGIEADVYDEPLFAVNGGTALISARQALSGSRADEQIALYHRFIDAPIDENSRRIWQGARDGAGVRSRAQAAMTEVTRYLTEEQPNANPLVIASLACGAASPVYTLIENLRAEGRQVQKAHLIDADPMALATAYSLGRQKGLQDTLDLRLESLIVKNREKRSIDARDLTEFIEPGSVDVVDLLGIFEYFPRPLAVATLEQVRKIMKPGGMIIFGNMLDKRPQQTFFTHVSLWPPLQQRSLNELFSIVDEAGFDAQRQSEMVGL